MEGSQAYAIDLPESLATLWIFIEHTERQKTEKTEIEPIASEADALLAWMGTPAGFRVCLWWRDDARKIGAHEWPSRATVNGGWATPGSNAIFIFRSEEWDRVLLHETIHALEWDWKLPKPMPCWGLEEDDQLAPALFEAWTELYAEWLWCGWHNVPWAEQRAWQDAQATQILARRAQLPKWSENTNVFAYYVLKAAMAPHIALLWAQQQQQPDANTLCALVRPELDRLRSMSRETKTEAMSLRMTKGKDKNEGIPVST